MENRTCRCAEGRWGEEERGRGKRGVLGLKEDGIGGLGRGRGGAQYILIDE